ncbi:MAG TPA: hypothetical protein VKZ18_05145 [Polyangia bacterium]|nr:hypothetical protein [Polyangia bacterium]
MSWLPSSAGPRGSQLCPPSVETKICAAGRLGAAPHPRTSPNRYSAAPATIPRARMESPAAAPGVA